MRFPGIVSLLLLATFIGAAYRAGWWVVMNAWDANTWAVVAFLVTMTWSISNDFGRGGGADR
jgi:hypothetical protein